MQYIEFRTVFDRLAQALGDEGLFLTDRGTDQQHAIQCVDFGHCHAEPEHAVAHAGIRLGETVVDVFAAQAAQQLGEQIQLLDRLVRAGETGDGCGAIGLADLVQTNGHMFQGLLPACFPPLPVLLEHRPGQAVWRIQRFIAVAVAVGDPALVDGLVFLGHDAQDTIVFNMHLDIAAQAVVGAHGFSP